MSKIPIMNDEQKLSALKGWATKRKLNAEDAIKRFKKDLNKDCFKELEHMEVLFQSAAIKEVAKHLLSVLEHESVNLVEHYIRNAPYNKGLTLNRGSTFKQLRTSFEVEQWLRVVHHLDKWAETGYISHLPL